MALEDLTGNKYISDLVSTNPVGATDPKGEGDDHIRGIKNVLKKTFPNINGAVTVTPNDINVLSGLASYAVTAGDLGKLAGIGAYTITAGDVAKIGGLGVYTITSADLAEIKGANQTITGFVSGAMEWLLTTAQASNIQLGFNIANYTVTTTWFTVGDSGSGEAVEWTALSIVPADAEWIEVSISHTATRSASGLVYVTMYARQNGSSNIANSYTKKSEVYSNIGGATSNTANDFKTNVKIPVSNKKFNMHLRKDYADSVTIDLFITGFGR